MKGKINVSHLSLLWHNTFCWYCYGVGWVKITFLWQCLKSNDLLVVQRHFLFNFQEVEVWTNTSDWKQNLSNVIIDFVFWKAKLCPPSFFLQMMDRLFDCLFYIDNVDLLGENCQAATDGFIMLHRNINSTWIMTCQLAIL